MVSVDGKGMAKTVSGEAQGDERKRTTDEVSKTSKDDVKTGGLHYSGISSVVTCLLTGRRPA